MKAITGRGSILGDRPRLLLWLGILAILGILYYLTTGEGSGAGSHMVAHKDDAPGLDGNQQPDIDPQALPKSDVFFIDFATTKGTITMEVHPKWAPLGVARLREMVEQGFFNSGDGSSGIALFRTVAGFVSQFGIHGDPAMAAKWRERAIKDDPVRSSNAPGTLSFASAGPNTRTTQLFFNLVDNSSLDKMGFAPLAQCVAGCEVLKQLHTGYGEKPSQGLIQARGNEYLRKEFPNLDYITSASIHAGVA